MENALDVNKLYKVNPDFIRRVIAGEQVVVPTGKAAESFSGMMSLNEQGAFIWEKFEEAATTSQVIKQALEYYSDSEGKLEDEIIGFVSESVVRGIFVEA